VSIPVKGISSHSSAIPQPEQAAQSHKVPLQVPHPGMATFGKGDRDLPPGSVAASEEEREHHRLREREENRAERLERESEREHIGAEHIGAEHEKAAETKEQLPRTSTSALQAHRLEPQLEEALVKQARFEFAASQHYLAASLWFDDRSLKGFAKLFKFHAKDESREGYAILEYIVKRRGRFWVSEIPEPVLNFKNAETVVESLYALEVKSMGCINDLVCCARKCGDYNSELFLHSFVRDATQSIDEMHTLLEKVKAHSKPIGLLHNLDKDLLHHEKSILCGECGGKLAGGKSFEDLSIDNE